MDGRLNTDAWPLVWVYPPQRDVRPEVENILHKLTTLWKKSEPDVLIFDLAKAAAPGVETRYLLAQHMNEHRKKISAHVLGFAAVTDSTLLRGMVTAVMWLLPPIVPHRVFASAREASDWAQSLLAKTSRT